MSLQEEEARQAAARGQTAPSAPAETSASTVPETAVPVAEAVKVAGTGKEEQDALLQDDSMDGDEDDEELARALAMSKGEDVECVRLSNCGVAMSLTTREQTGWEKRRRSSPRKMP